MALSFFGDWASAGGVRTKHPKLALQAAYTGETRWGLSFFWLFCLFYSGVAVFIMDLHTITMAAASAWVLLIVIVVLLLRGRA